jgi:hypothetical protein
MIEENFEDEMISEHIQIGELPVFSTGRLTVSRRSSISSVSDGKENHYDNVNIEKLLKDMQV